MAMSSVQRRIDADGAAVVEAHVHLTPEQAGAAADAVRALVSTRYRVPALGIDDILAMRDLTALGDGLDDLRRAAGISVVVLGIARLGLLRQAIGDAVPGRAHALLETLDDLHAEALHAALGGQPAPAT